MIRVAAVGDLHAGRDSAPIVRRQFEDVDERADLLLVAGDLTRLGHADEAKTISSELAHCDLPKVAVLGNHDYHSERESEIARIMREDAGVAVLERESVTVEVNGTTVGIAGAKGFGGGFAGASGTEFGEPEMKSFIRHTREVAQGFEEVLGHLRAGVRIALLHYAPIEGTLQGERPEIYPFLGSYLLAEAVDRVGADLLLHGHAHGGIEKGVTPGGIHVRNVAQPVIKHAYNIYTLGGGDERRHARVASAGRSEICT